MGSRGEAQYRVQVIGANFRASFQMYLGFFLIYVGTGLAAALWLVVVLALAIAILQNYFMIPPEERMCLEK